MTSTPALGHTTPAERSGARGAPGRVATVQGQAQRTLGVAFAFAVAAPLLALVPASTGPWLPLHVFLLGALLLAISATTQFLAVTWSAAPAPAAPLVAVQRWAVAGGAVGVVLGREFARPGVTAAAGAAIALGLVLLGLLLVQVRRRSVSGRFHPAIDAYLLAVGAGLAGTVLAVVHATGWSAAAGLRPAHLTLNLFGLVGFVVAGTVPYFVATQARCRMSPRATPARLRLTLAWLSLATAVTVAGHVAGEPALAGTGLLTYAAALAAMVRTLPRLDHRRLARAGPRLLQLAAGLGWWIAGTAVLGVAVLAGMGDQALILRAIVVGGFAQILVSSLAYLGPVLRGGGHQRLSAGFATTRSWVGLAAGNIAAVAALTGRMSLLASALIVWAADTALRALRLMAA
jgi:hypothetical protein